MQVKQDRGIHRRVRLGAASLAIAVLIAACGGGGDGEPTAVSPDGSVTNPAPAPGTAPAPGSAPAPGTSPGATPDPVTTLPPVAAPAPAAGSPPPATPGTRPRVFVITDINNRGGDPDDKQSLLHVLWYGDQLDIRGIVPDAWGGGGVEESRLLIGVYGQDYRANGWASQGFPAPDAMSASVANNSGEAVAAIIREADASAEPLYLLVWGGMQTVGLVLNQRPDLLPRLRVLTIATNVKYEGDCREPNWNATGRNAIFNDARFNNLWWVESDWTYNGMFTGTRPTQMLDSMAPFGAMGPAMAAVVADAPGLQYFRAGDTPTVLYMIDPANNLANPGQGSWAGMFAQPLPAERPNYWTDVSSSAGWNQLDPCASWSGKDAKFNAAKATLEQRRDAMYNDLLDRLARIYR